MDNFVNICKFNSNIKIGVKLKIYILLVKIGTWPSELRCWLEHVWFNGSSISGFASAEKSYTLLQ